MFSSDYKNELRQFMQTSLDGVMKYLKYYWMNEDCEHRLMPSQFRNKVYTDALGSNSCYPEKVTCGASKLVIMFEEYNDVVFKIPFIGTALLEEVHDTYMPFDIDPFCRASHERIGCWDYCLGEQEVYERVEWEASELEDFFCKTELLCFIDDHPVYVQERVKTMAGDVDFAEYRDSYTFSGNSLDFIENGDNKYYLRDLDWDAEGVGILFAKIYDDYGEDVAEELLRYMIEEIEDLHELNYGIDEKGYIQIFDYSGFDN